VLSLGGEEAIATIGADGKVTFNNPDHLKRLNSEDLLSLRLYLNGDAGNILWEYQIAGFSPFWSIYPDQQPQRIRKTNSVEQALAQQLNLPLDWLFPKAYAAPTDLNVADQGSYYTLGGMRVKLLFQAEKNTLLGAPLDIIWEAKVNIPEASISGNFYKEEDPDAQVFPNRLSNGLGLSPSAYLYQVYFEPATWDTGQDIEITARVRYESLPGYKHYKFSLKTRELYPVSASKPNIYDSENPQAPIQGADVAMLEGLLWQLGLSAQYNSPGKGAARINTDRGAFKGTVYGWTKNCQGEEARARNIYSVGWGTSCTAGTNGNGVSMEGMVRRFQGRSFDVPNNNSKYVNLKGKATTTQIHGRVDNATLSKLGQVWKHYREAVFAHDSAQYTSDNLPAASWTSVQNMLATGGTIPYVDQTSYNIGASYTAAQHTLVTANLPEAANGFTVQGLIRAWTEQESNNTHWGGTSSNTADYRLFEGAADDEGSMGFNHIVWKRLYGAETDCDEVRGYIGDTSNINMYNPINSLYGLIAAGSHSNCSSSNGLHEAFVDEDYVTDIPVVDRPAAYCYEAINTLSTANNRCATITDVSRAVNNFIDTQDAGMHLLGEAMVGYNAGSRYPDPITVGTQVLHYFGNRMLGSIRQVSSGSYVKTRFGYWMAIKGHTQTDTQPGYLPYTTYIWPNNLPGEAGLGLNLNNDDIISNVANADGIIEANTPWCYGYGELDWMSPFTVQEIGLPDRDARKLDYLIRAQIDIQFRVRCN
jgi:hypothetical protein